MGLCDSECNSTRFDGNNVYQKILFHEIKLLFKILSLTDLQICKECYVSCINNNEFLIFFYFLVLNDEYNSVG